MYIWAPAITMIPRRSLQRTAAYFTCNPQIGEDTMYSICCPVIPEPLAWNKLSLAPLWLRGKFLRLIQRGDAERKNGKPARIIVKMNFCDIKEITDQSYEASCAGVKIDMIVRGICCLKAGVPGLSENITVSARIIGVISLSTAVSSSLRTAETRKLFMGSADWTPRNLDRRVEIPFPVEDEKLKERLLHILDVQLNQTM